MWGHANGSALHVGGSLDREALLASLLAARLNACLACSLLLMQAEVTDLVESDDDGAAPSRRASNAEAGPSSAWQTPVQRLEELGGSAGQAHGGDPDNAATFLFGDAGAVPQQAAAPVLARRARAAAAAPLPPAAAGRVPAQQQAQGGLLNGGDFDPGASWPPRQQLVLPPLVSGKGFADTYDVVLLVDFRERQRAHRTLAQLASALHTRGANVYTTRQLPVGDALWVARCGGVAGGWVGRQGEGEGGDLGKLWVFRARVLLSCAVLALADATAAPRQHTSCLNALPPHPFPSPPTNTTTTVPQGWERRRVCSGLCAGAEEQPGPR